MSFRVSKRIVDGITILDLQGRVTLGEATGKMHEAVREALQDTANVILNLAEVPYMDSAGLGEMVGAFTTVTGRGGSLKLLQPQRRLHELLRLTRLSTVFETYEEEAAAIGSYPAAAHDAR